MEMTLDMTAHPRVGGENTAELTPLEIEDGSSPRRRGKRTPLVDEQGKPRLIPA